MYIKLETEFITGELPAELAKDADGNERTPTDAELEQAGWYRFVVEPTPAVQFGERLTYTRTTSGAVCTQVWQVEPLPADVVAALLAEAKASAHTSIDAAAGQIVRDVVGDRAEEYRQAEDEAKAWAAAQYAGNAPPSVASWAVASGLTPQAACDSILAQAAAWRGALQAIRAARLQLKALATIGKPELALAQWAEFERGMRAMLTA